MDVKQLTDQIIDALIRLDQNRVNALIHQGLTEGVDPLVLVNDGITAGLTKFGDLFEEEEIFLPELVLGGKIGSEAIESLKSKMGERRSDDAKGLFLIGTVAGDVHEIGKNLVRLMLTIAGYEVIDLGMDVPNQVFIEKVKELKPDFLGMSALLSTTLVRQKEVIDLLVREGLRDQVKVLVGGAPVHQVWADKIGADAYGENAVSAVRETERLRAMN